EGDGSTRVPSGILYFKSDSPLFGRTYYQFTDENGQFNFAAALTGSSSQILVPVGPFTLFAAHPLTGLQSPVVAGDFASSQQVAATDVTFTNAGIVTGHVRRTSGQIATGGDVQLVGSNVGADVVIAADGRFGFGGVPAGAFTLTAFVNHPQGSP